MCIKFFIRFLENTYINTQLMKVFFIPPANNTDSFRTLTTNWATLQQNIILKKTFQKQLIFWGSTQQQFRSQQKIQL